MTTAATIVAKLTLDGKDYITGIEKSSQATEKFWRDASGRLRDVQGRFVSAGAASQEFSAKLSALSANMQRIGGAMSLAFTLPIVAAMKTGVDLASSYEESLNKVNVVFEDSAGVVSEWSKTTAKDIGLSSAKALEAAGTYGNLFTAQGMGSDAAAEMSVALVNLSADMASFNNAAPEDVLLALRSGLSGEIEPLKKFGVAMNEALMKTKAMEMGLGSNIQKLSESEKIQVRYAIIMEQTAKAQGDFARTSGGLANQQRILKAQWEESLRILGTNLLPIVLKLVQGLNWMLEKFQSAPPFVQNAILAFLGLLALAGPVLSFIGTILSIATSLSGLGISFAGVSAAAGTAAAGVGVALGTILAPLLLIIATVALVYLAFQNDFGGIATTAKQLWYLLGFGVDQMIKRFKNLGTTTKQLGVIVQASFAGWGKAIDWVVQKVKNLMAALANVKLPDALTPGSPTPFEMGLRGISAEMDALSRKSIPTMNAGFKSAPAGITEVGNGGGGTYIDNRRFAGGMSRGELQAALDAKFSAVAGAF